MSWYILLGMIIAVALALLSVFQVPQLVGTAAGEAVGEAGFAVKRVEVKGLNRMDPIQAHYVAASQQSMAMPLVDLELTRERLLRLGWVREARVSRRWPDTLVVDIVERTPAAIWQHNQQLTLIDRDGVVLEPVKLDAMPDLPLVIGPAANQHTTDLTRLLTAAPQLKPMLAGATWVGGRRWDLRFHSGEVLALPEGEESAEKALVYFARMDKLTQLLGKGLVRFDMRIPGKFIVRVSSEPGSVVPAELAPPPPPKPAPAPANQGPVDPATVI
ncbi:MAG TPA: cell division protein FtsQ/DivIB [Allosphingosinicella sp.]|uniref:cell division protein FtsQ/DivIB n=1 Tax=Allosphingosinicella sp. TaxID=2823234 RepID=UPI002F2941A4